MTLTDSGSIEDEDDSGSIEDDSCWTFRKKSVELIELFSINKVSLV